MFLVKGFILQARSVRFWKFLLWCYSRRNPSVPFPPRFAPQCSLCTSILLLKRMTEWRRNTYSGRNGFAATLLLVCKLIFISYIQLSSLLAAIVSYTVTDSPVRYRYIFQLKYTVIKILPVGWSWNVANAASATTEYDKMLSRLLGTTTKLYMIQCF